jgi:hypothetical protein
MKLSDKDKVSFSWNLLFGSGCCAQECFTCFSRYFFKGHSDKATNSWWILLNPINKRVAL